MLLLMCAWMWGDWNTTGIAGGIVLLAIGEAIRYWAAGYIHKDDAVADDGPYGLVRNPLYLGSFFLAAGYTAMSGLGIVAWALVIGFFFLFHISAIRYEEEAMIEKFGDQYRLYMKRVPRLFPLGSRSPVNDSGNSRFSASQAINNREHITALVTIVTAVIFTAVLRIHHRL